MYKSAFDINPPLEAAELRIYLNELYQEARRLTAQRAKEFYRPMNYDRDWALFQDWLEGASRVELANTYHISRERVRAVIQEKLRALQRAEIQLEYRQHLDQLQGQLSKEMPYPRGRHSR